MSKYFCPYCNSKYQFKTINNTGKLLCGLCGEEMIKKSFVNIKQVISLIIVATLILPFFYTFVISIINRGQIKKDNYQGYNTELKKIIVNKYIVLTSS